MRQASALSALGEKNLFENLSRIRFRIVKKILFEPESVSAFPQVNAFSIFLQNSDYFPTVTIWCVADLTGVPGSSSHSNCIAI